MNPNKRNYKATFILDNRGKEESNEALVESLKKEIAAVQGEVSQVETIGRRDFARKPDAKFTAGVYVQVSFSGAPEAPKALRERLRLNNTVNRALIEVA